MVRPERCQAARKTLTEQIELGKTGAALTPYEKAVDTAQKAHDEARAAFTDGAGGPIYQAGVAEWMAKAAVTQSVADYDSAVLKAVAVRDELDTLDYTNYVPLALDELITDVVTWTVTDDDPVGKPMVVGAELTQYANANLNDGKAAIVKVDDPNTPFDETGVTEISDTKDHATHSNFDAAGRLIVPMSLQDLDDGGDLDDLGPIKEDTLSERMVADIRFVRDRTKLAAAALAELRDDNLNPALTTIYTEAARRAQAEADYYDGVYTAMLSDTTDQRDDAAKLLAEDNEAYVAPYSISSRNGEYQTLDNARFVAEQTLRAAVAAREVATANVVAQFTNPTAFYEQLVSRRQALKVAADRKVAAAAEDGGTVSESLTDDATAAATALTDAEEAQAKVTAALGDEENPTAALVAELLKTGGDDGQALVDAISAVYDTATSAVSDAEGIIDELRGPVALNTAAVANHEDRITQNEGDIVALDGRVTTNEADIEALDGRVTVNEGAIAQNADDIMMNAGHIMENRGMIETNATGIMMNAGMIAEMGGAISSNTAGIATNAASITTNSNGIRTLRSGVAAAMAMAGMPEIGDRGVAVGAASYDGESAFAVGVHFSGENSRFKAGITSSGGETGISVGAGWGF